MLTLKLIDSNVKVGSNMYKVSLISTKNDKNTLQKNLNYSNSIHIQVEKIIKEQCNHLENI